MNRLVYRKGKRKRQRPVTRVKMSITKGDTVQVISGEDKGKRGRVLRTHPKSGRITIEGVNIVKRHRAPTGTTEGGIMEMPAPIHHSKAMLIDPKTNEPTRIRRRVDKDGTVERIATKSGDSIPRNR